MYDGYGNVTSESNALLVPKPYLAFGWDVETGLCRPDPSEGRQLPSIGVWNGPDPIGFTSVSCPDLANVTLPRRKGNGQGVVRLANRARIGLTADAFCARRKKRRSAITVGPTITCIQLQERGGLDECRES
jgi:hypothetical protein